MLGRERGVSSNDDREGGGEGEGRYLDKRNRSTKRGVGYPQPW